MIKFLHFRCYDSVSLFVQERSSRGGCTVAYTVNDDDTSVHYAKSVCHVSDNYNKKLGRIKATGKLLSEKLSQQFKGTEKEFIRHIELDQDNFGCYLSANSRRVVH